MAEDNQPIPDQFQGLPDPELAVQALQRGGEDALQDEIFRQQVLVPAYFDGGEELMREKIQERNEAELRDAYDTGGEAKYQAVLRKQEGRASGQERRQRVAGDIGGLIGRMGQQPGGDRPASPGAARTRPEQPRPRFTPRPRVRIQDGEPEQPRVRIQVQEDEPEPQMPRVKIQDGEPVRPRPRVHAHEDKDEHPKPRAPIREDRPERPRPRPQAQEIDPFAASLTAQEQVLLSAMVHKRKDAATSFALDPGGRTRVVRVDGWPSQVPPITKEQMQSLLREYADDPKEPFAWVRESLLSISRDTRLTTAEKESRLDRYLDAYCSLTIALDRQTFRPTGQGVVREGVPSYIPHGFNDMGRDDDLNAARRGREMIHVNKEHIFETYKPALRELFSADYSRDSLGTQKEKMLNFLALRTYMQLPYDHELKKLGGGKIDLAHLTEGVCRHQALVFQTLAQVAGLKTKLIKTDVGFDGKGMGPHATNAARINGDWYLFDVTNPDYARMPDGVNQWRSPAVRIDRPPFPRERRVYDVTMPHSRQRRHYETHDRMFWTID